MSKQKLDHQVVFIVNSYGRQARICQALGRAEKVLGTDWYRKLQGREGAVRTWVEHDMKAVAFPVSRDDLDRMLSGFIDWAIENGQLKASDLPAFCEESPFRWYFGTDETGRVRKV